MGFGSIAMMGVGASTAEEGNELIADYQRKQEAGAFRYEIPQEIQQNLTQAEQRYLQGLHPSVLNNMLQEIYRGEQSSLNYVRDLQGGLRGAAGTQQQTQDALSNVLTAQEQAQGSYLDLLMGKRGIMAGQKAQQWKLNVLDPSQQQYALGWGLRFRGEDTWMAGMQQQNEDIESMMGMMMGQGGGSNTAASMTKK